MIYHRCDRCNNEMKEEERNKPLIRQDTAKQFSASLLVMDRMGRMVEDMCVECKLNIINTGKPSDTIDFNNTPLEPQLTVVPSTEKTPPAKTVYEPSSKT